jgi:hypothetical protein
VPERASHLTHRTINAMYTHMFVCRCPILHNAQCLLISGVACAANIDDSPSAVALLCTGRCCSQTDLDQKRKIKQPCIKAHSKQYAASRRFTAKHTPYMLIAAVCASRLSLLLLLLLLALLADSSTMMKVTAAAADVSRCGVSL